MFKINSDSSDVAERRVFRVIARDECGPSTFILADDTEQRDC